MKPIPIASQNNARINFLKKLGQKKHRNRFAKFLVENMAIVRDAAQAGFFFDALFVTEDFWNKNGRELDAVLRSVSAGKKRPEYYLVSEKVNRSFSSLDTPSGIGAIYSKLEKRFDFNSPVIYLNKISDPGNLGTILRTALAFSFGNVVVDESCADVYSPKTIAAAKDAIFKLNIQFDENLKLLEKAGEKMEIFSTVTAGPAEDIGVMKGLDSFCLVFGNEAHGVDEGIIKLSDHLVRIKTEGDMESLNVASAAAIILYETRRHGRK